MRLLASEPARASIDEGVNAWHDSVGIRAFLSRLAKTKQILHWDVTRRGEIRARLQDSKDVAVFSPITAVAYAWNDSSYTEDQWNQAAEQIGLSAEDRGDIFVASNYDWDPNCRQGLLRRQLLDRLFGSQATIELTSGSSSTMLDPDCDGEWR